MRNIECFVKEPNYIATVGGDFFGLFGDDFIHIPSK
jgi:hypothetical protein